METNFDIVGITEIINFNNHFQLKYKFKNGFGASIIKNFYSYGNNDNLFELAVLKNNKICYSTKLTSDVIGFLSVKDCNKLLNKIKKL